MAEQTSIPLIQVANKRYKVLTESQNGQYESFSLESEVTGKDLPTTPDEIAFLRGKEIIVLDSVKSGKGRTAQNDFCSNVIEPIFHQLQISARIIRTYSQESVAQHAQSLAATNPTTIVIFLSGDTTISEFINNLNQSCTDSSQKPSLWLLPLPFGTGNAWTTSLEIQCPVTAFGKFLQNKLSPKTFPLYKAIFPNQFEIVFFIILSIGFHANLLHLCEQHRFHNLGVEKFRIAAQEILESYKLDYPLIIPGQSSPSNFAYFALINTPHLEKTYKPSPKSDPLKSELHVLGYSAALTKPELIEKIMKGYSTKKGDDISADGVTYKPFASDFDITFDQQASSASKNAFEICCDGHLLNMIELQQEGADFDGRIKIRFLDQYSSFDLKVLTIV
ncbi:LANO_0E05622g1_1 [Lachancea nothofagi CBS 11611]|uniref:LANO_0E05622g1_1 n=1 Tax=Lachancea nothofagi CBS 11611 TaxID=1266666 RepID=A0A1G4JT50_9SACH|nr:LANO_0E05622g1_1 [Lachancea nothofagi CBS 11611]